MPSNRVSCLKFACVPAGSSHLAALAFPGVLAAMLVALLGGCVATPFAATAPTPAVSSAPLPALVSEFAPTGTLRAAINFGNPILASKDASTGEMRGVSVDLARELGRRLALPVELVPFNNAGKVVEATAAAQVDIAFVAIDPVRGAGIGQTPPYVIIEGAYLVKNDSPIRSNAEVDRAGNRVMVSRGSAYDLFLTRELKAAKLIHTGTSQTVVNDMLGQGIEVAAGVKQQLEMDARRLNQGKAAVRLLDGRFMVINQAMGLPKGRDAAQRYLNGFVEEMKASGFVAQALARHGIEGAAVAPPTRNQ
jgi:polar amino acid transport system substrate-binding protein